MVDIELSPDDVVKILRGNHCGIIFLFMRLCIVN